MATYIGIVHKDPNSDFGVCFPDFLGCISAGSTMEELKTMAEEVLNTHIEILQEQGMEIPNPSNLKEILKDPDYQDLHSIILVKAHTPGETSDKVRVNVSFPKKALNEIDTRAKAMGLNRSAFLILATRAYQIPESVSPRIENRKSKTKRNTG